MPTKKTSSKKKTARPVSTGTAASGSAPKKRKTAKKKVSVTPAPLPVTTTHLFLLIDESSSMSSIRNAANAALKTWANDIKASSAANEQKTIANITFFATGTRRTHAFVPVQDLDVSQLFIRPNGNTVLYYAMYEAAEHALAALQGNDDSALLVVVTDGEDTASAPHLGNMQSSIRRLLATTRADVALMVPPGTKASVARLTGLELGAIREWEATEEGVRNTTQTFTSSFNNYYANRSKGVRSMRSVGSSFYVDPDDLTKRDLSQLKDISKDIKLVPVTHRDPERIDEFFEARFNRPFEKGKVFYELTKSEKLQSYKTIIVQDMESGKAFSGADARSLLGIAFTGEVRVRPGKDKKKRVFIQSTSLNRKLVTGTEVVFWENA